MDSPYLPDEPELEPETIAGLALPELLAQMLFWVVSLHTLLSYVLIADVDR